MASAQPKPSGAFRKHVLALLGESYGDKTLVLCPTAFVKLLNGDHKAAILLAQILYWSDKTRDPDGWFYKSYREWTAETGLSEAQVRRIVNGDSRVQSSQVTLRDLGVETLLRKVKHTGAPTLHYRINQAQLLAALHHLLGQGDSQQWAGSTPDNAQDEPPVESGMNAEQSAASSLDPQTTSKDLSAEDQLHQSPGQPDDDADFALFSAFEARFGKLKTAHQEPLRAELTRLGTSRVGQVLERCATRGRSWAYVLKALANEQPEPTQPEASTEQAGVVYDSSEAVLPVCWQPEAPPDLAVSVRVEQPWAGAGPVFRTVREVWDAAYHQFELQLDQSSFETCGRGLTLVDFKGESATFLVVARSECAREMLQQRLHRTVRRILCDVCGQLVEACFLVKEEWIQQCGSDEQTA